MCLTISTEKNDTMTKVTRIGMSFLQGTFRTMWMAGTRAVNMASRPDRAVASPKVGMMNGSTIMMKIPKPKPQTLWVTLAPRAIRNINI